MDKINTPSTLDGLSNVASPSGIASPNRRGFRPAWAKDGGTFGTPKAADVAGASSDFGQLSLSGPGGPPMSKSITSPSSKMDYSSWGGIDTFDRPRVKKPVIRMNRDEILALRKPSDILPDMVDKLPSEMISLVSLEPESFKPLDERAIYRIWHDQPRKGGPRQGQGRGRGGGGSPLIGSQNGRWGGSPGLGPSAPGAPSNMPSLGLNSNKDQQGWRRGMAPGQSATNTGGAQVGNSASDPVTGGGSWGKKTSKENGTGGFFLAPTEQDGDGSWARGMKLEDTDGDKEDDDADFFGDDDDDDNLDLAGLSSTALQFEMEKQKMQGRYEQDQEIPSSVNASFASLFGFTNESERGSAEPEVRPPSPPAPVSKPNENSWYYLDPKGLVQGPFKGEQMKMWHKMRYFESTPNLPVRNGTSGDFLPLSSLPNAFEEYDTQEDNNQRQQEEQRKQQVEERERQARVALEQQQREEAAQKRKEAERLKLEQEERRRQETKDRERERVEKEQREQQMKRWEMERDAKHAAEEERRRLQKAALDALMEKQAADERAEQLYRQQMQNRKSNEVPTANNSESDEQSKKVWGSSGKGSGQVNLADIQQEEKSARTESEQLKQMLGMGGAGGSSPWGAGSSPVPKQTVEKKSGPVKSLLDIQAEEQRAAAMRKKTEPKATGGHWAALASNAPAPSAKGVWGPGRAPAPAPTQIRATSNQTPSDSSPEASGILRSSSVPLQTSQSDGWEEAGAKKGRVATMQSPPPASTSVQLASTKDAKAFGGPSLGSGLNAWCAEQLRRLTGSDDMTLIHFCMSLDDPAEIRSYLSAYLGSKPEVSHFATEFIRRKQEAKRGGQSAASVVSMNKKISSDDQDKKGAKKGVKGKKGKKVDPSLLGYSVQSNRIMQGEIDHGE